MRYRVVLTRAPGGLVAAACPSLPGCRVEAATREEALARIRNAIGYYDERCPCDVTAAAGLDLDVVDERAG